MGEGRAGRAVASLRASTPTYDVDRGLARFSAAIAAPVAGAADLASGSSSASATAASAASTSATAAKVTAAGSGAALGAGKSAAVVHGAVATQAAAFTWLKLAAVSTLFVGSVGTAVLVSNADPPEAQSTSAAPALAPTATKGDASPSPAGPSLAGPSLAGPLPEPSRADPSPVGSTSARVATEAPSVGSVTSPSSAVKVSSTGHAAVAPPAPAPESSPASSSAAKADSLPAEMEHLAQLRRTSDPARALALAEEGHARFPRGLFWQERESIAIASLARVGRGGEAKARARAFVASHPESLHADALRRLISGD